jgi:E3 ubiquitin-protein ligase MARCH6
LFTGSVSSILSLPINVFSTENIGADILQGCAVVTLTLLAFIGLVWLREQILHGGGPEWLEMEANAIQHGPNQEQPQNNIIEDDAAAGLLLEGNLPAEPAPPEILENNPAAAGQGAGNLNNANELNVGDDGQWNPMEWDRAAEELTWERLLGLDGSLVFLEHVFWVVSLNTLFILVFAFSPYHIGHFTIMGFKLKSYINGAHFEGMLTTLCGYCVIGICLVTLHSVTKLLRFKKFSRVFGLCYVVVKVALLLVIEIVAFPVICGWWLDICSLALFDASLKDRQGSYHQSPMASIFMHWLVGMVYVFYFASFVILLREVLRPGVLWFLRNLNDPDFNPIQEMIHLSICRHLGRFCASLVMFGTSILVMLYLPSRIIKKSLPTFLPYQTATAGETQVDELAMELLLLLVVLPAVQDQNHTREWLKNAIRAWCSAAAWILDLRSYLFGDTPEDIELVAEAAAEAAQDDQEPPADGADAEVAAEAVAEEQPNNEPEEQPQRAAEPVQPENHDGLAAAHQALLQREGPMGFQPYKRPGCFPFLIFGLIVLMLLSWLFVSLIFMLVPVFLGRQIFALWFDENPRVYELYTSAMGLYTCLLLIRGATLFAGWVQQGWLQLSQKLREWAAIGAKASVAFALLVGLIPLLFGLLLEVVALMPARVPLNQSPVFFLWQDWALGAMYTKITIALTFMGPDWWLKRAIEQLYQDGLRGLNLSYLIPQLIVPAVTSLGLALAVPYVIAHGIVPLICDDFETVVFIQRRIYPSLLLIIAVFVLIILQLKQFRKLYEHIKNDRYLVGRRLVNYNHKRRSETSAPTSATSTANS